MKNLCITLLLILTAAGVAAGEYTFIPKGTVADLTVRVENLFSDLVIEGGPSSEIRVMADDYEGMPEKAAGLMPLSARGPDNTGIGLNISQEADVITISGTHRNRANTDYRIILPTAIRLKISYGSFQTDDVTIKGMASEVEIKSQVGDLDFIDVTGPIIASTMSGDIGVIFAAVAQSSPTSISSVSGDIDITLPESAKGTFTMNTISGEVYTDLDFDMDRNSGLKRFGGGMSANATLNGGGVNITLRSVSGDIFIRKAKP
jgi:hypothetical protein